MSELTGEECLRRFQKKVRKMVYEERRANKEWGKIAGGNPKRKKQGWRKKKWNYFLKEGVLIVAIILKSIKDVLYVMNVRMVMSIEEIDP